MTEEQLHELQKIEVSDILNYVISKNSSLEYDYKILRKKYQELNTKIQDLETLVKKYREAANKCLHITFMGAGCQVHTIAEYSSLIDGYLTDVEKG